jgi:hypothetical protein
MPVHGKPDDVLIEEVSHASDQRFFSFCVKELKEIPADPSEKCDDDDKQCDEVHMSSEKGDPTGSLKDRSDDIREIRSGIRQHAVYRKSNDTRQKQVEQSHQRRKTNA